MLMLKTSKIEWISDKLGRLILKPSKILIPILIIILLLSSTAVPRVSLITADSKWDWETYGGENNRDIRWSWGPEAYVFITLNPEWIGYIDAAADTWNDAGTGWGLQYSSDPETAQILVEFDDIDIPVSLRVIELSYTGYLKKAEMLIDTDTTNNPKDPGYGWGIVGETMYDPKVVAAHGFGHFLKLQYSDGTDDKMNFQGPGYHSLALSASDISAATNSNTQVGNKIILVLSTSGQYTTENGDKITIPTGAISDPLMFKNLIEWDIPDRTNTGTSGRYISTAVELETNQAQFNSPVIVSMVYQNWEINGGLMECVNYRYPPLIEADLEIMRFNPYTEGWQPYPGAVVDIYNNTVTFQTVYPGIYGITGPLEYDIIEPAKPSTPSGQIGGKVGVEYTYTTITDVPIGNEAYFWFDWGDGNGSGWIGPCLPDEECSASHTWETRGTYEIKVKAKNEYGWESVWSDSLEVSMPKTKTFSSSTVTLPYVTTMPTSYILLEELVNTGSTYVQGETTLLSDPLNLK